MPTNAAKYGRGTMASIRPVNNDDVEHLSEIERSAAQIFRKWPGLEWLAEGDVMSAERHLELARHYFSWVAVDEDDFPTGFLRAERAGDEMHIWEISVSANRQGEGMGLASLQKAIAEARDTRFLAVTLTTFSEVPWNAPFYQRLGFQKLAADDVGKRLNGLLQVEVDHGLPIAQRCAMRLML